MGFFSVNTPSQRCFLPPQALASIACSWFLSASTFYLALSLLSISQVLGRAENKKIVSIPKAYLLLPMGQAGHEPPGLSSTVCLISGIRWTELDPSYPHASSLSMKHQQLAITPKSTKMVRNLSINFIWLVYRVLIYFQRGQKRNSTFCFLWRQLLSELSFWMKTLHFSPSVLLCVKSPVLVATDASLTLKSFSISSTSFWDHLTFWNAAGWLFWRGLNMEITFRAFQE